MTYTVYKTTNLVNGNFYLGVHKTNDPEDDYLGSGNLIQLAIKKHGRDSFRKEVLFEFEESVEAFAKEKELLSIELGRPVCYNLHEGGYGGWDYINTNDLRPKIDYRGENNPNFGGGNLTSESLQAMSEAHLGRVCSNATREKLSQAGKGRKLSPEGKKKLLDSLIGHVAWNRGKQMPPEFGAAITRSKRGKSRPKHVCQAVAIANSNRAPVKWIHKDGRAMKVKVSELEIFLQEGWRLGRK